MGGCFIKINTFEIGNNLTKMIQFLSKNKFVLISNQNSTWCQDVILVH